MSAPNTPNVPAVARHPDAPPERDDALTREVDQAASLLTIRERTFCDMVLNRDVLGMTFGQCYVAAGYDVPDGVTAGARANAMLDKRHPKRYILAVQARCMDDIGLTLSYLDHELKGIIESDISDLIGTRGINRIEWNAETKQHEVKGTNYLPELRCNIDDLTPTQRRSIQSIEMTTNGIKVKQYDRLGAIRLAYQRIGALVEKKEHSGPGGGPISLPAPLIQLLMVNTNGTESQPAYTAQLPADDTDERLTD